MACVRYLTNHHHATVNDARITHQVIDRPYAGEADGTRRERVQPQWLYDSINARTLLPTYAYWPGQKCPAHLSPFTNDLR